MNDIISHFLSLLVDFGKSASKVGLGSFSDQWMVIAFFAFVIILAGFTLGRNRILIATLSIYAAVFIENRFVYFQEISKTFKNIPSYWLHVAIFLALMVMIFLIFNRSVLRKHLTVKDASVFQIVILAVLNIGFLTSVLISYLPVGVNTGIPTSVKNYFGTKTAQLVWAVLPLIAVLFLKKGRETTSTTDSISRPRRRFSL